MNLQVLDIHLMWILTISAHSNNWKSSWVN